MPDVRGARHPFCEPTHGQDPAPSGDLLEERVRGFDFGPRRGTIRGSRAGVGGHGVPADGLEAELRQGSVDDRGGRFSRSRTRQLALGGEGDSRDACAAESRCLPHEQDGSRGSLLEVSHEPIAAHLRAVAVPVEVVGLADLGGREAVDELLRMHTVTMLMAVRGRVVGVLLALCLGVSTAPAQAAAPPQGYQSDAAFAASYRARGVTSVTATTQRVSCYAPEVLVLVGLAPSQGFPQGGGTPCPGATTGENIGPYPTQDVKP